MNKFIIEEDFWALFPDAEIAVILAKGIDNSEEGTSPRRHEIDALLLDGSKDALRFLGTPVFSENPVIAVWRQAYQQFKTKKGARCSIEALLKRIEKGTGIQPINPLVDIYNSVSLKYGLPCGGEDMDTFQGDLRLTKAMGGEAFIPLGDSEPDNGLPGEILYKDEIGAVCRCWNWRDGQRTMLTAATRNAFLIIESVDPSRRQDVSEAASELARLTTEFLGGVASIHVLDAANREVPL